MSLAASRGEGTGNTKYHNLLAGAQVGNIDLSARVVLVQLHGRNATAYSHWCHFAGVERSYTERVQVSDDSWETTSGRHLKYTNGRSTLKYVGEFLGST